MKDTFGEDLDVGDSVVYISQVGATGVAKPLVKATVVGFTPTKVRLLDDATVPSFGLAIEDYYRPKDPRFVFKIKE